MHIWSADLSLLYVGALFAISLFFVKKAIHSYEEFSLCGRTLTISYVMISYFGTWIGGGSIIGLVGLSYLSGLSKYWVLSIPYLIGFPFAFLFITRIRKLKQYSIGDMMALRYPAHKQMIRIPVAVAVIIRNVTVIGMQFSAISYLVVFVFGINRNLAILLIFLVITSYTALSGLWGIVATDMLQGFLQAAGLLLLFFQSYKFSGGWHNVTQYFQSIHQTDFLSLFSGAQWYNQIGFYVLTIGLFFLVGDQGDWQKINSCKSDKVAFWGYLTPLCITMLWLLIPAYVGIMTKVYVQTDHTYQFALYHMVIDNFSPLLASFVLVCLLAAVTSSADSFLLSTGLTFSRDIVKFFLNPAASDKELIFWSRFFVLIAGGMGFAFAICINDLINLWITGLILSTSMILVPYLLAWFSKSMNTEGAVAGMAAGGIAAAAWLLGSSSFFISPIWVGITANLLVAITVGVFVGRPSLDDVNKTYYWSDCFKGVKNIP